MDEQKIKAMLERYFDGATSLPEEQELQRFFTSDNVPATLKPYSALFAFYAGEKAVTCPAPPGSLLSIRLRRWTFASIAAAAVVALLVTLKVLTPPQDSYIHYVDGKRVYNREAALQLADAKLQMLAASVQHAKASMETFEKLSGAGRHLEQLDKIRQTFRQVDDMIFLAPATDKNTH
jgi:hypothetical protein